MIGLELPPGATRVTVLRHGEVQGRAHVMRGDRDDPLSAGGWARMATVLEGVGQPPVEAVASSPRLRCLEFAHAWADARSLGLTVLDGFREMSFGAWEGLTPQEAFQQDPERHRLFQAGAGTVAPPGGESLADLRQRVRSTWDAWLEGAMGGHRLLVTHAGVMRALLMELVGLPPEHAYRITLPEAAHFQVSVLAGEAPILLNLNPCAA